MKQIHLIMFLFFKHKINIKIFSQTAGQARMFRVLKAYANFDREIGYTQGMNFIVAALLYCLNPDNDKTSSKLILDFFFLKRFSEDYCLMDDSYEIKVFWIFVHIMHEKKWRDVFKDGTPKLLKMLENFQKLVEKELPNLNRHFNELTVILLNFKTYLYF